MTIDILPLMYLNNKSSITVIKYTNTNEYLNKALNYLVLDTHGLISALKNGSVDIEFNQWQF